MFCPPSYDQAVLTGRCRPQCGRRTAAAREMVMAVCASPLLWRAQQLDDLRMSIATRVVDRQQAELVAYIRACAQPEQVSDDFDVAGVGGTPERGAALRICGMDIRTALDKQSYNREMTRVGRKEQRQRLRPRLR